MKSRAPDCCTADGPTDAAGGVCACFPEIRKLIERKCCICLRESRLPTNWESAAEKQEANDAWRKWELATILERPLVGPCNTTHNKTIAGQSMIVIIVGRRLVLMIDRLYGSNDLHRRTAQNGRCKIKIETNVGDDVQRCHCRIIDSGVYLGPWCPHIASSSLCYLSVRLLSVSLWASTTQTRKRILCVALGERSRRYRSKDGRNCPHFTRLFFCRTKFLFFLVLCSSFLSLRLWPLMGTRLPSNATLQLQVEHRCKPKVE